MKSIKLVTVGDAGAGKTCSLISYTQNSFPTKYVPTVFDDYSACIIIDGEQYNLDLWDTAGHEGYTRIRKLAYANTDVFLVAYSVVDPISFEHIPTFWIPELRSFCEDANIIIVGNKIDLLNNTVFINTLHCSGKTPVTIEEADRLAKEYNLAASLRCSALTQENLKNVYECAIRSSYERQIAKASQENVTNTKTNKGSCTLL